jgi:hypothetical protein
MKLVIRGHVRQSLDDLKLYNLIRQLSQTLEIELYIQTWTIKQNNLSWRPMSENSEIVTIETITAYFKDLVPLIKQIIILDESKVPKWGRTTGVVCKTLMPILGWKYMLYGIKQIVDGVYGSRTSDNDVVLLTRFDILKFKPAPTIVQHISNSLQSDPLVFANGRSIDETMGCDNLILSRINTLKDLVDQMLDLDTIVEMFPNVVHQEALFSLTYNRPQMKKADLSKLVYH